jgi:YegS/Rv2252/BmrU family lipid kinase
MSLKKKGILKTQIIVNPQSDKGRTGKRWKLIKEVLRGFIKEYKCEFTEKPYHATEITRAAVKEGSELIVGIGGDGTINEIANGFFEDKKIINPASVLGIVPSGTGSDFSRSLNIPKGFQNAMKVITEAPSTLIDTGTVSFRGHSGEELERYFLNIADFGIGGEVCRNMELDRKERKKASYLKSLIITFIAFKNKKLRIKIDENELPVDEYMIGAISNGRIFGKGMKIAPKAELNDGLFDVVLIKGMKILEFCANAWRIYAGNHLSHKKITLLQGKKVEVYPEDESAEVLIEIDGEPLGKAPARFEIVPGSFLVKSQIRNSVTP